jgi:hypothetical protein
MVDAAPEAEYYCIDGYPSKSCWRSFGWLWRTNKKFSANLGFSLYIRKKL